MVVDKPKEYEVARVTKQDIVRRIANNEKNIFAKDAQTLVDIMFREMSDELANGDRIEIRGFGTFTVKQRDARIARNPKTNTSVKLDERSVPYFRAGKELKDRLNSDS